MDLFISDIKLTCTIQIATNNARFMFSTTIRSCAPTCSVVVIAVIPYIDWHIGKIKGRGVVRLAEGFAGLPVIHPVDVPIIDIAVGTIVINVIFDAAS